MIPPCPWCPKNFKKMLKSLKQQLFPVALSILPPPFSAEKACEAVVTDTTQLTAISDEGLSHSDTHTLPQAEKTSLRHKLDPQNPERIGLPLPNAVVFSRNAEEVEEEVEVDVLLCTPVPESRVGENGLDKMDIFPEEEEEEDVNEIDVTGDEAE